MMVNLAGTHASWPRPHFRFCSLYLTTCLSPSHPQRKPKITASRKLLLKVRLRAGSGGHPVGDGGRHVVQTLWGCGGSWGVKRKEAKVRVMRGQRGLSHCLRLVVSEREPESMESWHLPRFLRGGSDQLQGGNPLVAGRGPCFILARVSVFGALWPRTDQEWVRGRLREKQVPGSKKCCVRSLSACSHMVLPAASPHTCTPRGTILFVLSQGCLGCALTSMRTRCL